MPFFTNKKNFQITFLVLSYLINILMIVLIYGNAYKGGYSNVFYTSDHLFTSSLFNDIINDGNSLKGWNLPGAPAFLPDMIIYVIIYSCIKNLGLSFIIYSSVQVSLLLLFFNFLIRKLT